MKSPMAFKISKTSLQFTKIVCKIVVPELQYFNKFVKYVFTSGLKNW